jgi:hypothetical protein
MESNMDDTEMWNVWCLEGYRTVCPEELSALVEMVCLCGGQNSSY